MKSLIFFYFSFYLVFAKHELYDGHVVYEVNVKNIDEIAIVNDLANKLFLDVWSHAIPGKPGQILVPKSQKIEFEDVLNVYGLEYKIEVENIRELLELEDRKLADAAAARNQRNSSRLSLDRIYTYDEVNDFIEDLASSYPNLVRVVRAGTSIEGRAINYLEISTTNFQNVNKPIVMLQSLLHAREWITLPSTLYAIHKLVVDVTESDLINNIDWIILPVANPDGYVWTYTNARFWRKNRRRGLFVGDFCMGVDLNRNFDVNWGTASSNSPCMDTYHGTTPLSEPETQTVSTILNTYRNRIALFGDIHSFGSLILYGFGNGTLPQNALTLNLVGVNMAQAIDAVKWPSNPNYIVGNIVFALYPASGGCSDYAQNSGVPFSYTYELPSYRNSASLDGFLVDPDFIEQAGFETWEGIKTGARYILSNTRLPKV